MGEKQICKYENTYCSNIIRNENHWVRMDKIPVQLQERKKWNWIGHSLRKDEMAVKWTGILREEE